MEQIPIPVAVVSLFLAAGTALYITECRSVKKFIEPKPTIYQDLNGDGVLDKVVENKTREKGLFFEYDNIQSETFYGVKKGNDIEYLTNEEFMRLKK